RHWEPCEPARDQERLASDPVSELAGEEVRQRLHDAEADEKGENDGFRNEAKVGLGDQREDGALEPHHGTDEGVDHDEQRELAPVWAEAEPDGGRRLRQRRSDWRLPPARWGRQEASRLRSGRRCGDGLAVLAGAGRGTG